MQFFPFFILIVVGLVFLTRPLTVLLHELGHAIPAFLLTRRKVTIYIGSYGDPKKSLKLNIGALEIFFRYNPLAWRLGLCEPSAKEISVNKQIIFTLTGPLASLLLGSIACYLTFGYDLHGFWKLFLIVFLGSAFVDLLINLVPSQIPIQLYDGTIAYNDGYNLKLLLFYKRLPKGFSKAADLYNQKRYVEAAILGEDLLTKCKNKNIYRLVISSYLQDKNYEKAKQLSEIFIQSGQLNSDDHCNYALALSFLGHHEKAMKHYEKSLQLNPDNLLSLNNKGYTLNLMNRFEEAIPLFDRAIELDKDFSYSYNNRGLSLVKLGLAEEGLKNINYSLELNPDNSYGYKHLGIYYLDKRELKEALALFVKAKQLDASTHMIDDFINATQHQLKLIPQNE